MLKCLQKHFMTTQKSNHKCIGKPISNLNYNFDTFSMKILLLTKL